MSDDVNAVRAAFSQAYHCANVAVDSAWGRVERAPDNGKVQAYRIYEAALEARRAVVEKWEARLEALEVSR